MRILEDARLRPKLFVWYGRPSEAMYDAWMRDCAHRFPSDLIAFWHQTGGGDVFETESILGPFDVPIWGDSLRDANEVLRQQGLPNHLVAIHKGSQLTVVDEHMTDYIVLDPTTFKELARYGSFEDWYGSALRAEYAARYGLPTP